MLSTTATVEAGATTEVTATLRPKTGTLSINTTPEGANITLDGMNVGLSPVTEYGVSAGNHTVNATLAGYVPVETEVTVIADQPVTSTIALTKPASLIPGNLTPLPVPVTIGACAGAVLLFAFFRPRTRPVILRLPAGGLSPPAVCFSFSKKSRSTRPFVRGKEKCALEKSMSRLYERFFLGLRHFLPSPPHACGIPRFLR